MLGLEYLINPHTVADFIQDQYGKKAILIPGDEEKFAGLFDWDAVNYLSRYSSPSYGSQRLVMDKQSLPEQEFKNFSHWINRGATFVINHLQTKHPPLDEFARVLGGELNTPININAYISTESKQGFDNHHDRHDVFIVQTEGVKHWKIFWPTIEYPLEYMKGPKGEPPDTEPYLECDMSPGDVLYIPRGHWHYALASNSSIHLTVGATARSPIDFLQWFVQAELWTNPIFRRDFPIAENAMFYGRCGDAGLEEFIKEFQEELIGKLTGDNFMNQFKEFVMASNHLKHVPRAQFPEQQMLTETIDLDTVFQVPLGQKILLQYDDEKQVGVVLARGATVQVEGIGKDVLASFFDGDLDNVTGRAIIEAHPDTKEDSITNLLVQLVEHGVLELRSR